MQDKNKPTVLESNGQFGKTYEYIPPKIEYTGDIKRRSK